jgi:hypothetical protein
MPYKDPERKRQWEQTRRQERTARRKSQRHAFRQVPRPTFVKGSPWATHPTTNPLSAAALAKARQLREGKTQAQPSSKNAAAVRSLPNERVGGQEGHGTAWGFWLAVAAAVVLGPFLVLAGISGRDTLESHP